MRLFVAVNLPGSLKARIAALQRELALSGADVKWVEEENLHLTVKFLGEMAPERLAELEEALARAVPACRAFRLELSGLGTFPARGVPRVLWVGVGGEVEAFRELYGAVERALAPLGFTGEGREFRPHLTLGRVRSPRGVDVLRNRMAALDGAYGDLAVGEVALMESRLTPRGPIYRICAVWGLRA
ncbi:MAG: RNA 2',3'-cyclic phosphodiesterase [Desulfotomaculales bacterium]